MPSYPPHFPQTRRDIWGRGSRSEENLHEVKKVLETLLRPLFCNFSTQPSMEYVSVFSRFTPPPQTHWKHKRWNLKGGLDLVKENGSCGESVKKYPEVLVDFVDAPFFKGDFLTTWLALTFEVIAVPRKQGICMNSFKLSLKRMP